jgi:hypothetical protein
MSESPNKEFYDLLSSAAVDQFSLSLSDKSTYSFKQLTTSQLRDLVKTVVDSPLTQAQFNNTLARIIRESTITPTNFSLDIVDRLLFCIETRIQSISPNIKLSTDDGVVVVDLNEIKSTLNAALAANGPLFETQNASSGQISITYGVPFVSVETQLNDEFYKNIDLDVQSPEELRKVLGDTFINEIAKTIRTVTIQEKVLDLSTVTFKSRIKTVESLPANLIGSVIEYIEKYKKVLDDSLVVSEGLSVPIDGSLFSIR